MKNKILKKIVGIFGYKLIDKNHIKNNRILEDNSYLSNDVGKDSQMLISEYFYNLRGKRSTALPG